MSETKKVQSLGEFVTAFNTKHGKGTIAVLADGGAAITHWGSTGIYSLDDAMNWGIPGGRIVEFFGAESSGKTTALMAAMVENERNGGMNFVFDAEGTFDLDRYKQMGGNPNKIYILDPGTAEQFYDRLKQLVTWANKQVMPNHNAIVLIGLDSMASLIPKDVMESESNERVIGALARVNSQHLPTVDDSLGEHVALVIINQVRDKIGNVGFNSAADANIDTPGGRVIKHHSSVRVFFNKAGQLDNGKTIADGKVITGMKTDFKVVKCKVGPPLRRGQYRIMFDHKGVDGVEDFRAVLESKGLIPKPVQGVHTIKVVDKPNMSFTKDTFAKFISTHPKWTAKKLEEAFDLPHNGINVERYLVGPGN